MNGSDEEEIEEVDRFDSILATAIRNIEEAYFLLPSHKGDPRQRERVYCYELYHQMRSLWPKETPFFVNGEVDKHGHAYFHDRPWLIPDFVVHGPGSGQNYAVLEVKPSGATIDNILADFESLNTFLYEIEFPYARGLLLVYGDVSEAVFEELKKQKNPRIEVWLHTEVGHGPTIIRA